MFHRNSSKITLIPYYGGAKGQSLQLVESSDGTITTAIVKTPYENIENQENELDISELENPFLPSKFEFDEFGTNIRKIQNTASNLIKLQEIAKRKGSLSEFQETQYKEGMETLSQTALKLANMQEQSSPSVVENREGLSTWFEKKSSNKNKDKKKEEEDTKKKEAEKKRKEEQQKREEEKKKQEKEEEKREQENKRKEEEEESGQGDDDTIEIDLPEDDASVAEAKPVGLAIAGEGGVAASKPIATAVVGRGGLAIARPVATAIAGVDPKDSLYPSYIDSSVHGGRTKSGSSINKEDSANGYLNRLISKYHQN
ncbi:hypothetical protein JTB14_021695 [Gonioctena quinquepunctata]|nr:hypothetical protein JTB14_021695 [Gonioctena quinquepunctata]